MKEKLADILNYILMGSTKHSSEKKRLKELEEREAIRKFLDGFKEQK